VGTEKGVCKSVIARVHNSGSLFQSNVYNIFIGDLAAVRIKVVSIMARCPQGESRLYFRQESILSITDLVADELAQHSMKSRKF